MSHIAGHHCAYPLTAPSELVQAYEAITDTLRSALPCFGAGCWNTAQAWLHIYNLAGCKSPPARSKRPELKCVFCPWPKHGLSGLCPGVVLMVFGIASHSESLPTRPQSLQRQTHLSSDILGWWRISSMALHAVLQLCMHPCLLTIAWAVSGPLSVKCQRAPSACLAPRALCEAYP